MKFDFFTSRKLFVIDVQFGLAHTIVICLD